MKINTRIQLRMKNRPEKIYPRKQPYNERLSCTRSNLIGCETCVLVPVVILVVQYSSHSWPPCILRSGRFAMTASDVQYHKQEQIERSLRFVCEQWQLGLLPYIYLNTIFDAQLSIKEPIHFCTAEFIYVQVCPVYNMK